MSQSTGLVWIGEEVRKPAKEGEVRGRVLFPVAYLGFLPPHKNVVKFQFCGMNRLGRL